MTASSPEIALNDGGSIPALGLGVMFVPAAEVPALMEDAVRLGYRHFDTATHYHNEAGVGEGLTRIEIARDELFVTTKLPNNHHGYDEALRAFDASEKAIGRIDLYLIHWPQPPKGRYLDCWRALVRLREEGRVRSIGVANFPSALMTELVGETGVWPAVNQIELHPRYQQYELRAFHAQHGIVTQSWSPLEHGRALGDPTIQAIAMRHGRSPAQIILRWHIDNGLVVIPKAADREHLRANFEALDVRLSAADMAAIAELHRPDGCFGPDPMQHVT